MQGVAGLKKTKCDLCGEMSVSATFGRCMNEACPPKVVMPDDIPDPSPRREVPVELATTALSAEKHQRWAVEKYNAWMKEYMREKRRKAKSES